MKQLDSILEFTNKAAVERINYELAKVVENILNPNTDEKPRKLVLEMTLTPINGRKMISTKTAVKKVLRPTNAVHSQIAIGLVGNAYQLMENGTGLIDGQIDIFGNKFEAGIVTLQKTTEE